MQNLRLGIETIFYPPKNQVIHTTPYVSQFAHPDYAEKVLKENIRLTSDPRWQDTGAQSPEEYAEWALTICGMACTSMILRYFKNQTDGIVSLARDAQSHGVYKDMNGELSGMQYHTFVDWIQTYGIRSTIYTRLGIHGIQRLLSKGSLVIVSVNPNIRGYQTTSAEQKGGHLVLVTGYDTIAQTVTLHNPSGFASDNTQANHVLAVDQFLRYYAGRGVAVSDSNV